MVDSEYLLDVKKQLEVAVDKAQWDLNKMAGKELNVNSPKQMQDFFIHKLGRPIIKYTKGGKSGIKNPSVDEEVMTEYSLDGCPYADQVIKLRHYRKMLSTYVVGILESIEDDYCVHPNYTQHIAATGRQSSRDPNLHNIPRADKDEFQLREAFIAPFDHDLISADYEQIEMRLLAHRSGEPNFIKVICEGKDIHIGTASLMYDIPYEDLVWAKKEAKRLKDAKVPENKWDQLVHEYCGYRQDSKQIGFGQYNALGRSKTCSKRGNLSAQA
jgi:DNA polymerase-1